MINRGGELNTLDERKYREKIASAWYTEDGKSQTACRPVNLKEENVPGFDDKQDPGNGPKYYTGEMCIVPGCKEPAGTKWGKFWCFDHNVERIIKINSQFESLLSKEEP